MICINLETFKLMASCVKEYTENPTITILEQGLKGCVVFQSTVLENVRKCD